jgi:large subunit ribosomal protein L15
LPTRFRKTRKRRGGRTVGWGQVGQHRKHGAKGGYGKAGLHKHKWSWVVKYAPDYFGSHGFVPPNPSRTKNWLNVGDLDRIAERVKDLTADKNGKLPVLELSSMGISKLLGSGSVSAPYLVRVSSFTNTAKAKVESAGGRVEGV